MNHGMRTIIYPVKDIARAKTLYSKLLGTEPSLDEAYYVGYRVGDQDMGLDPNGHSQGMTGPVSYWHVDDIKETLEQLLDAGAEAQQAIRDVGGGKLIASVKDADGNTIGLIQSTWLPVLMPGRARVRGPVIADVLDLDPPWRFSAGARLVEQRSRVRFTRFALRDKRDVDLDRRTGG